MNYIVTIENHSTGSYLKKLATKEIKKVELPKIFRQRTTEVSQTITLFVRRNSILDIFVKYGTMGAFSAFFTVILVFAFALSRYFYPVFIFVGIFFWLSLFMLCVDFRAMHKDEIIITKTSIKLKRTMVIKRSIELFSCNFEDLRDIVIDDIPSLRIWWFGTIKIPFHYRILFKSNRDAQNTVRGEREDLVKLIDYINRILKEQKTV